MASLLNPSTIIFKTGKLLQIRKPLQKIVPPARGLISNSSGAMLPEPVRDPMGLLGFAGTVLVGLTLGATISKHIASFLEENDLFVPADDDDDD